MVDPFRGGSFGSVGMGPFQTGGGDFSRYNIADDGDDVALTRKYSAQIAWANGTISDAAYLDALEKYIKTTDRGSRERISAQNEYDDAVYTIGRNKLVRAVNNASSSSRRVAALRSLLAYDQRRLGTMRGDNEQARELRDRISDAESQIRDVRYSDLVRRFNANGVSIGAMLAYARQAAASSQGGPDHETWLDRVREWEDRAWSADFAQLQQDYEHQRIPGSTIIASLRSRLARMDPGSPAYAETVRAIEDWSKQVTETDRARRDDEMARRVANGKITSAAYLRYLHTRIDDYAKGTSDRRAAQDAYLDAVFKNSESTIIHGIEDGTHTNQDLADLYRTHISSMNPGSALYLQFQAEITKLLVDAAPRLDIGLDAGGYGGAGRWVDLTGAPGGTPVNAQGYASQFDGSTFASQNCGMASAAMLAWAVSGGRIRVSGGELRYYSGDRDARGDETGTTYDDITAAFQNIGLGLRQYHGMGFNDWKRRLLNGEGSLISGFYGDAPAGLRLTNGYDFTHTMYVDRAKRKADGSVWFFVMDPLGRSGYEGQWWPEEAIRQYGWSGTANSGGGQWLGDVAFATRRGRSATYYEDGRAYPPAQSFDTDWRGRSTIGRGGGTSREEAGRRQDWSEGRPKREDPPVHPATVTGGAGPSVTPDTTRRPVTDEQVTDFLAAVDGVRYPTPAERFFPGYQGVGGGARARGGLAMRPGMEQSEEQDRIRAKALLEEWGGDARLAAIGWFTGTVNPDTATWGATERFYANAVGGRLGYEPVARGGSTATVPYEGQDTVTSTTIQPTPAPSPVDLVTSPRPRLEQDGRGLDSRAPQTADMARRLLDELGIEATPDMVRAVVAWIATEGTEVRGNNPFVLRTSGRSDLPGQVGRDETSLAVFGTLEDGIRAAADQLRQLPQVIMAMRSGDPERFLVGLDRAGWTEGGYGGTLVRTYNELPGDSSRIIGGAPGLLQGPHGLEGLARLEPSIAEIFDIDPRDPTQLRWLEQNIDAAKIALEAGASSWTFTRPDGTSVGLDFTPSVVTDLTSTRVSYAEWTERATRGTDVKTHDAAVADLVAAHGDHARFTVSVAVDEWSRRMDALDRARQVALGSTDYGSYLSLTAAMADATKQLLGQDPSAPLDPTLSESATLLREQGRYDDVVAWGEKLDSDPVVGLVQSGYVRPRYDEQGRIAEVVIPPDVAFVGLDPDGSFRLHTVENDQTSFRDGIPVASDPNGQTVVTPPAYTQTMVNVPVGGRYVWVPKNVGGPTQIRAVVIDGAGYRRAVIPDTGVPAQPGSGQITTLQPGRRHPNMVFQPEPTANVSPWLLGTRSSGPPIVIDGTTVDDRMRVTSSVMVPVDVLVIRDALTGRTERWYSIRDGRGVWLGGDASTISANPPQLVLGNGASIVGDELQINGEKYDEGRHGAIDGYVHWYGMDPSDGASPTEMGADSTYYKVRQALPTAPGGGTQFDTGTVDDPVQAFLEGDSTWEEALRRSQTRDLAVAAAGAPVGDEASRRRDALELRSLSTPRTGADPDMPIDFAAIGRGLAGAGFPFGQRQVPMNAGVTKPVDTAIGAPQPGTARLSSSIFSTLQNTLRAAEAARVRIAEQAAMAQRLADARARERAAAQAREAALARAQQGIQPNAGIQIKNGPGDVHISPWQMDSGPATPRPRPRPTGVVTEPTEPRDEEETQVVRGGRIQL